MQHITVMKDKSIFDRTRDDIWRNQWKRTCGVLKKKKKKGRRRWIFREFNESEQVVHSPLEYVTPWTRLHILVGKGKPQTNEKWWRRIESRQIWMVNVEDKSDKKMTPTILLILKTTNNCKEPPTTVCSSTGNVGSYQDMC